MAQSGKEYQRLRLLGECIQTEKSYIDSLQTFYDVFVKPIATKWPATSGTDGSDIFTRLDTHTSTVIMVSKQLMREMEEADVAGQFASTVGDVFATWAPMFKSYKDYVSMHRRVAE